MSLEIALKNVDTASRGTFMLRFDVASTDSTKYEFIRKALDKVIATDLGGKIQVSDEDYFSTTTLDPEALPGHVSYSSIVESTGEGQSVLAEITYTFLEPGPMKVGIVFLTHKGNDLLADAAQRVLSVEQGSKEMQEAVTEYLKLREEPGNLLPIHLEGKGPIDYWVSEVRKESAGSVGAALQGVMEQLTGAPVRVRYEGT